MRRPPSHLEYGIRYWVWKEWSKEVLVEVAKGSPASRVESSAYLRIGIFKFRTIPVL